MQINSSGLLGLTNNNNLRLHFKASDSISERLSSGLRINHSADDPSGLGIAAGMRATIGGLETAAQNAQDGLNMIYMGDKALDTIGSMLMRGRDLAVRAANFATNTADDRNRMQAEVDALLGQIDNIAATASYNGKKLLDGGAGRKIIYTSQADWQAGTQFAPAGPSRLDTVTVPGSLKLKVRPWNDPVNAYKWVAQTAGNQRYLNPYITSFVDNGDGTANVQLTFRTCRDAAAATFTGSFSVDPGITNIATTAVAGSTMTYAGGGQYNFSLQSGAAASDRATVSFKINMTDTAQAWTVRLTAPAANPATSIYFGNDGAAGGPDYLGAGIAVFSTGSNFTDMYDTVTWRSAPTDTGGGGGTATLTWDSDTAAGNAVAIRLYESNDQVTWSALPLVENGGTFDFTQRYVMAEALLTSSGINAGAPALNELQMQLYTSSTLQIGENNTDLHRLALSPVDGRTSALGVQDIDITTANKAMKVYDSKAEWVGGTNNLTNIDMVSNPGIVKLASPISNVPAPILKFSGNNMFVSIDNPPVLRADGTYDVDMSLSCYGQNPPGPSVAQGWRGTIRVFNGDGTPVTFSAVSDISIENAGNVGWPIPAAAGQTGDVNYVDSNNDGLPDTHVATAGGAVAGTFQAIFFDYYTTTAQDGVAFSFNADPDAYIQVTYDCVGYAGNHALVDDQPSNIYFQDKQVGNSVDGVPGSFTFTRRLQEYGNSAATGWVPPNPPVGTFDTSAFYFGGGNTGSLSGTGLANGAADKVQFEVYESTDGIGGWNKILNRGAGVNFTVDSGFDYVYVKAFMTGTAATSSAGPGNALYSYNPSTTPTIDDLRVTKNISPITEFNNAIDRVNQIRADLGVTARRILTVIESINSQRLGIINAESRIMDADFAEQSVALAKEQILTQSATAVSAQGDPFAKAILDLEGKHNIGEERVGPSTGIQTAPGPLA